MAMYCNQILTEALFAPLMAAVWYFFILYRKKPSIYNLCIIAVLLGIGTLIRTVTMYIPLFIVPFLLLEKKQSIGRKGLHVIFFLSVFISCLLPWIGRNYYLFGHGKLTTQGSAYIAGWIIPAIAQNEEGMNIEKVRAKHVKKWNNYLENLPIEDRKDIFRPEIEIIDYFVKYLKSVSLFSVIKAWTQGIIKNLFVPTSVEIGYMLQMDWTHFSDIPGNSFPEQAWNFVMHNSNKIYSFMLIGGIFFTLLFRLIQVMGMWLLLKSHPKIVTVGVLLITYFLAVNGPVGFAKYRLPFEPVLILFVSMAVAALPFFKASEK
jgi:4-amino-4-deoxy-L-arabinose transferase-like glycosyltransferase